MKPLDVIRSVFPSRQCADPKPIPASTVHFGSSTEPRTAPRLGACLPDESGTCLYCGDIAEEGA